MTLALQELIDDAPDGATVILPPGHYHGALLIQNRWDLTVEADGATIHPEGKGLQILHSVAIKVRGLAIEGTNHDHQPGEGTREGWHGVDIIHSAGVEIDRCTIADVFGDGIYVGGRGLGASAWVAVRGSSITRTGRQGIAVTAGTYISLSDLTIDSPTRAVIDLEPNVKRDTITGVRIRRCHTIGGGGRWLAAGGNAPVNNVTVEDCTIEGKGLEVHCDGQGGRRRDWTIRRCTSDTPARPIGKHGGSGFWRVDGLTFTDNVIPLDGRPNRHAVYAQDCTDIDVSGNDGGHLMVAQLATA